MLLDVFEFETTYYEYGDGTTILVASKTKEEAIEKFEGKEDGFSSLTLVGEKPNMFYKIDGRKYDGPIEIFRV